MGLIVVELLIGGVLAVVLTVIGLFFGHIIIFDSIALALVAGLVSHGVFHIHPALSLLIGIITFFGLFFLQNTKVGFWIIGGLLSLIWGFIFAMMAYEFTGKDMIWTYVVFGLATADQNDPPVTYRFNQCLLSLTVLSTKRQSF